MKFKPTSLNEWQKLYLFMKTCQLKPVKQIKYSFDPYTNNVESLRTVMTCLNSKRVMQTSFAKTVMDIKSDKASPQIDVEFTDGHQLIFKTEHLKACEIIETLSKYSNARDTTQQDADMQLTKMSGKPKRRK